MINDRNVNGNGNNTNKCRIKAVIFLSVRLGDLEVLYKK